MKQFKFLAIIFSVLCLGFTSCKDDVEDPMWVQVTNPEYSVSMTAVVRVEQPTNVWKDADDKIAAFINGECRGVGVMMGIHDKSYVYFISIIGAPNEQQKIQFQYYSARANTLYKSKSDLIFEPDVIYGTIDAPQLLQVK